MFAKYQEKIVTSNALRQMFPEKITGNLAVKKLLFSLMSK